MLEQLAVVFPSEQWEESVRGRLSSRIATEFPSIFVLAARDGEIDASPHLTASRWRRHDFDVLRFDRSVDELAVAPFTLVVADDCGERGEFSVEVLNRCQRLIRRRNHHSQSVLFDAMLSRHAALHDLSRPAVRADYDHTLDVWQWVLRLDGGASLALQIAALFHDVERLVSGADEQREQLSGDYATFQKNHALLGAAMAQGIVAGCGGSVALAARVGELISGHEERSEDAEAALLNDADGLSWFSLHSPGYADSFGPKQTRTKIAHTRKRMSARGRAKMNAIHLRADIEDLVREVARADEY